MAKKSTQALVTPAVVRWARESIGMDLQQAAKKIGVSVDKLRAWEEGSEFPTLAKLRDVGRVYERPIAVFYLDEPPKGFKTMKYFRRLPGAVLGPSAEFNIEVRRAVSRREVALEMAELVGDPASRLGLSGEPSKDPDDLAARARQELLRVTMKTQQHWSDEWQAFREWRTALEEAGVLVFQVSLPLEEMQAASIFEPRFPVILINSKQWSVPARTFSLMHELGHLVAREGAACDVDLDNSDSLEVFCNAFAGRILVPKSSLADAAGPAHLRAWSLDEVRALARTFWVSTEVMFRRLVDTGRASARAYSAYRASLPTVVPHRRGGGGNYYRNLLARNGAPYLRLVLQAFREDRITTAQLADYVGAKVDRIRKIEALVYGLEGAGT